MPSSQALADQPVDGKYIGEQPRQAAQLAGIPLERCLHTLRHSRLGAHVVVDRDRKRRVSLRFLEADPGGARKLGAVA